MEKVIRDGKVAVLITQGYAGWYSWTKNEQLLFSPKIVKMVEQNRMSEINKDWIRNELGIENVYCGGVNNLKIHWLPIGTPFTIEEYDGIEVLHTIEDLTIIA